MSGTLKAGREIGLRIDQTLTQDATGTLVMLELEAMGIERTQAEVSVQYVDHNLLQLDERNPDDHRFLESAAARFGIHFSPPGNGVSHPVHQQRFGIPGKTLVGSDSHTPAAGALGMLAIGAGGIDVAMSIAGEPLHIPMPEIWGIELEGEFPDWVSAKDLILELLRRHGVSGGKGFVLEYYGPGLKNLDAMDRHVIANMGTELGATSSVFPSDAAVRDYLAGQGRSGDWQEMLADGDAYYDRHTRIDLSGLEPLIAQPSSPGNVVPVTEVAGKSIGQSYVGSSANPGFRDFAIAAEIVSKIQCSESVSLDINPSSRQTLEELTAEGYLGKFISAGARIHQAGCNGCIGMGQAPASEHNSVRTVPRNFPGRSGNREDRVFLSSPETAAASATGKITDPRDLGIPYPRINAPRANANESTRVIEPLNPEESRRVEILRGPNIVPLSNFEALPQELELTTLLKLGDDVSTDEIMPAGARVLPYRSNIPRISEFCFEQIDKHYSEKAKDLQSSGGHAIIAGENYGQGSSREHAALAPRFLGLRFVIAKSYARIHEQNLINFGILPLTFHNPDTYDLLEKGSTIRIRDLRDQLTGDNLVVAERPDEDNSAFHCQHRFTDRQIETLLAGGLINRVKAQS